MRPDEYCALEDIDWGLNCTSSCPEGRRDSPCLLPNVGVPPSKTVRIDNLAYRVSESELKRLLEDMGLTRT